MLFLRKCSVLSCLVLFLLMPKVASSTPTLETVLAKTLRFSPEQIEALLAQPIPAHAQREIDYGFVDEDFVRFMMGALHIRNKIRNINAAELKRLIPQLRVDRRYRCASIGLNQLIEYLGGGMANDCIYLWTELLVNGSELPYDLDTEQVLRLEPWKSRSIASLEYERQRANEFIAKHKIPAYLHDDLLSLRVDSGDLLDVFHETVKHPREEFTAELAKIQKQPAVARRFGRIICAPYFDRFNEPTNPWERTCYAYWHRYMDMGGDGDTISAGHSNSPDQDPRQFDFRPPPPTRAEAELGELMIHGIMWRAIEDQMCGKQPAACSKTLKRVVSECREKNESLRQAYLDDPRADDRYEQWANSVSECAFGDKQLAPYLPMDN
ncbi:MAG: hypothetical protein R3F47_06655 [Gammaproteobacteria bacterium]